VEEAASVAGRQLREAEETYHQALDEHQQLDT